MKVSLLLLSGLATWRLASLLHTEDLFGWLRRWIGIRHDDKGYPVGYPETFLGTLFECFWCLSLAAAVPITVLIVVGTRMAYGWAPLLWLSSSALAIWLEKQIMRTQSR